MSARIGYGTRAPTDPPIGSSVPATHTLWYGDRPTSVQDLYVIFDEEDLPSGAFAVYDDDGLGHRTQLPEQNLYGQRMVAFRVNPAHHYWIGVGCASARPLLPLVQADDRHAPLRLARRGIGPPCRSTVQFVAVCETNCTLDRATCW